MRTASVVTTPSGNQDVIIGSEGKYKTKSDGTPEFIDEQSGMAKFNRHCQWITIYEYTDEKLIAMTISAQSILDLANEIVKINSEEYNGVVDAKY